MAVGMGDEGPGDAENPRIAGERPLGQFRQLAIVARRQIVADLADLLFDQVIVVEHPFSSGDHASATLQLGGACAIACQQNLGIVAETCAQGQDSRGAFRNRLRRREACRVLLESFDAEQFLPYRRWIVPGRRRGTRPGREGQDRTHEDLSAHSLARFVSTGRPAMCAFDVKMTAGCRGGRSWLPAMQPQRKCASPPPVPFRAISRSPDRSDEYRHASRTRQPEPRCCPRQAKHRPQWPCLS